MATVRSTPATVMTTPGLISVMNREVLGGQEPVMVTLLPASVDTVPEPGMLAIVNIALLLLLPHGDVTVKELYDCTDATVLVLPPAVTT